MCGHLIYNMDSIRLIERLNESRLKMFLHSMAMQMTNVCTMWKLSVLLHSLTMQITHVCTRWKLSVLIQYR